MRVLLLFFVFLNIGFYYWASHPEFSQDTAQIDKKVPPYATIQTLLERDTPIDSLEVSVKSDIQPISREPECVSMGPFENIDSLSDVYSLLINAGVDATQKTIQQRVPKSYWIYLLPHESLDAAKEKVAYLEEKNIKEHFIMRAPEEQKYSISLGLFSELEPANELMEKIKAIDLLPQLDVRFDDISEYWIHYIHPGEGDQADAVQSILDQDNNLNVRTLDC